MRQTFKLAITALVLLLLTSLTFAISTDQAIAIVSTQNNYLMPNETAAVSKGLITYNGVQYTIVAAQNGDIINAYIPINNSSGEIASQDLEVRELIKATIIYKGMSQLNQSVSSADWPFSYSTKSYFYDLSNDFGSLMNSLTTVKTELNKINDTDAKNLAAGAGEAVTMADDLAAECTKTANSVEKARVFETDFFNNPDTNKTVNYEDYYSSYFDDASSLKEKYNALDAKLTSLSQGIGALETQQITVDQKSSFQALLSTPTNARKLPSFFGTTDQLRTEIESIFNSAKNSDAYATTLASRKVRSEAWLVMYGTNDELAKLDPSFTTLEAASTAVLSEENAPQWNNQDAVSALKANWSGAVSRFNNAEYDKAKEFAAKAISNIKLIINDGVKQTTTDYSDLMTKAVIGLVVLVVVIFVLQNFILKKKKPEESDEPEYK